MCIDRARILVDMVSDAVADGHYRIAVSRYSEIDEAMATSVLFILDAWHLSDLEGDDDR